MEDKINTILNMMELPPIGTFIEVGAYDGETHSYTARLADQGWIGYYFEPIKEYADKCRERHKDNKVMVINKPVGKGVKKFKVGGESTTTNDEVIQVVGENGHWFGKPYKEEWRELQAVTALNFPKPDLLVVDVEGMEYEAIQECPLGKYIIVELHKESPEWQSKQSIRDNLTNVHNYLTERGYREVYSNDIDSLYENINYRA